MTEKEKDDSMNLPEGVTCDSCFAFSYCKGIGCTWAGRKQCDYYPNRYSPKLTPKVLEAIRGNS